MKAKIQIFPLVGIVALTFALSGCQESTDVTLSEQGVYKGAADPLVGNIDSAALRSRFELQMDR